MGRAFQVRDPLSRMFDMKIGRYIAGGALAAGGYGLAAMSGVFAFDGFVSIAGATIYGFIGPCVALVLAGAGTGIELEIKNRNWPMVGLLAIVLAGIGWLDQHSGQVALQVKADARQADYALRLGTFEAARDATADARKAIADAERDKAILDGEDVEKAQRLLGVKPDGAWGQKTSDARAAKNAELSAAINAATAKIEANAAAVRQGAPVKAAAEMDPHLYSIAVTFGAVLFSFLGSVIAFGLKPDKTKTEMEAAAEAAKTEAVTLVRDALQERTGMLRNVAAAIRQAA